MQGDSSWLNMFHLSCAREIEYTPTIPHPAIARAGLLMWPGKLSWLGYCIAAVLQSLADEALHAVRRAELVQKRHALFH